MSSVLEKRKGDDAPDEPESKKIKLEATETDAARPRRRRWGDADTQPTEAPASVAQPVVNSTPAATGSFGLADAVAKARQVAAMSQKIAQSLSALGGLGANIAQAAAVAVKSEPFESVKSEFGKKAAKFTLDADGNLIDAEGNIVKTERNVSSLKINAQLAAAVPAPTPAAAVVKKEPEPEPVVDTRFYDPRGASKRAERSRGSGLQFFEAGSFIRDAEFQRGRAEARMKHKTTRIHEMELENPVFAKLAAVTAPAVADTPAAPAVLIDPFASKTATPDVEWWDAPLLPQGASAYSGTAYLADAITSFIQHPRALAPLIEAPPAPPVALRLTKAEAKKVRRRRKLEKQQEITDKIRLGLMAAPEPRVKLSNMATVLSNAAVENPTALEAKIKADAAMRRLSHELRNEQNKLTPGERAAKKLAKITEDASGEMRVCIFRIADFTHKAHQFKVDINAKQLKLTGCAILWESYNVVIAEGGAKAMKRFMRVMQHRIKWDKTGNELDSESDEEDENESAGAAKSAICQLVWSGTVQKQAFAEFRFERCRTEAMARKYLSDRRVGHYWDMAKAFGVDGQGGGANEALLAAAANVQAAEEAMQ